MEAPPAIDPGHPGLSVEERLRRLEEGQTDVRAWVREHDASAALRAEVSRRRLRRNEADLEAAGAGGWSWRPLVATPRFSPACHRVLGPERRGLALGRRPEPGAVPAAPVLRNTREVCLARLHPEDVDAFEAALDRFLQGGSPRFHRRVRVRDDTGHWPEVLVAAGATETDGEGRVTRMAGVVMLVPTDGVGAAVDPLRPAARQDPPREELDELALLAQHDLRSPLRTILGFSEHLGPLVNDDADAADAVARIHRAGDRMLELVERVTVFATLARTPRLDRTVELNDVLRQVLRRLEAKILAADAHVVVGPLPAVRGDADMLVHVFQEILQNALTFSGDDPPVVRVQAEGPHGGESEGEGEGTSARIHITDGGIGFEAAMAEAMFEPYRRLNEGSQQGSGLGLSIARRAVERHGGGITVEPAPGGRGTRFVIVLPGPGVATPPPALDTAAD